MLLLLLLQDGINVEKLGSKSLKKLYLADIFKVVPFYVAFSVPVLFRRHSGKGFEGLDEMRLVGELADMGDFRKREACPADEGLGFEVFKVLDGLSGVHPGELVEFPGQVPRRVAEPVRQFRIAERFSLRYVNVDIHPRSQWSVLVSTAHPVALSKELKHSRTCDTAHPTMHKKHSMSPHKAQQNTHGQLHDT